MAQFTVRYIVLSGPTAGETRTVEGTTRKRKAPTDAEVATLRDALVAEGFLPAICHPTWQGIRRIGGIPVGLAGIKTLAEGFEIVHDQDIDVTPLYRETVTMVAKKK